LMLYAWSLWLAVVLFVVGLMVMLLGAFKR